MNLAALLSQTVSLKIHFSGDVVNAEYLPHKMTPKFRAFLIGLDNGVEIGEAQKDSAAQMAAEMLASWDVDYDGQPFPPTYDNLLTVPIELLSAVVRAIWTDLGKRMSSESDG